MSPRSARRTRKPDKEEEVKAEKAFSSFVLFLCSILVLLERAQIASQRFTISINEPQLAL
jgi:hypothetical protein